MAIIKHPLPKRLKEARLAAGISQKQLGLAAGMDEFSASPRMNQYETGKHTPDFLTLKRIAKVLDVPAAYFYAEDEALVGLLQNYTKLDKESRLALLQVCEKFMLKQKKKV